MLLRLAARVLFIAVLVPISWARRLRGSSRFGRRAHSAASAWDH
jgi:hypothetical protein